MNRSKVAYLGGILLIIILGVLIWPGPKATAPTPPDDGVLAPVFDSTELIRLKEVFGDNPFSTAKPAYFYSRWVSPNAFMFVELNEADQYFPVRYFGIGYKGLFCQENLPNKANGSFSRFRKASDPTASPQARDQGYWLTRIALADFDENGKKIKSGPELQTEWSSLPECGKVGSVGFQANTFDENSMRQFFGIASFFDDQPFRGGQVTPFISKFVNKNAFIFAQFDRSNGSLLPSLRFIGVGLRGKFCSQDQLPLFSHFHRVEAEQYGHAYGGQAGDDGYWLGFLATRGLDDDGLKVEPGLVPTHRETPPPTC